MFKVFGNGLFGNFSISNTMLKKFHSLYFESTRNCNFSCKYCSSGSSAQRKCIDIPYDKIVERILEPAYLLGTRLINFSGGEFLLRHDAIKLLKKADAIGFNLALASNGSMLTEDTLKNIKEVVGHNIIFSLGINSYDLLNKETREVEAEYALKTLARLEKFGFRVNISITIGAFNRLTFQQTVERIRKLHLPFNRIPFVPRNCAAHELMFDKETLKNYFHPVLRKHFNGQVSYTPYMLPPEVYEKASGQNLKQDQIPLNPSVGCWVGAYYAINPEGDVSPCPMFLDHVTAGNVLETPLEEILYQSELFTKITQRDKLEGKCGNCKYTQTCGGCRVMAYYKTGNVFAEDPTCFLQDLNPQEIAEIEKEISDSFKNYLRMAKFGNLYNSPE